METAQKIVISIRVSINAPVDLVWKRWTTPDDIAKWNNASEDWLTAKAKNDLRPGGKFNYRMEAKDGSFGFDFEGTYNEIKINRQIKYTISDGRKVEVNFSRSGNTTVLIEYFEAENVHPFEMQRQGWQAILDNFKHYTESKGFTL